MTELDIGAWLVTWFTIVGMVSTAAIALVRRGYKAYLRYTLISAKIDKIAAELVPNSGSSLRDAVDRIEAWLLWVDGRAKALMEGDRTAAMFETNRDGDLKWANQTFVTWTGLPVTVLYGGGWSNAVHKSCRDWVYDEWLHTVEDEREFSLHFYLTDRMGAKIPVLAHAYPMRDAKKEVLGYVGILRRVPDNEVQVNLSTV